MINKQRRKTIQIIEMKNKRKKEYASLLKRRKKMETNEFRKLVYEDIKIACELNRSEESEEFLNYAISLLINGEEFDDFNECHCEGLTQKNGFYSIDGYSSIDETDGSCCIFINDYHGPNSNNDSIIGTDVNSAFKKIRFFVEESTKTELFKQIDNSEAKEFSRNLFYDSNKISKYRFYLITDAYNLQRKRTLGDSEINNAIVELNVWDIERLHDLACSQTQKEIVEINLKDSEFKGIPCVKAGDFVNVEADIDIFSTKKEDYNDENNPSNIISYSSYLAVVPGNLLNELFLNYGAKLLEGNVRSFLSAKRKVNKGIQNTIKNYPAMFFAYNNGIAATATKIEIENTSNGPIITYIKGLQIVNGGQTTASIANTYLAAKHGGGNIDLTKVVVPMKLSVLEQGIAEKIIPKISEYSNSQNPVDVSDFFSNHPFHIRMEEYSRKTPIPVKQGKQYQQYWFYERTRGQYNQEKMRITSSSIDLKKYIERYPENMIITMIDLAKYMTLYECKPHIVSKGKQKYLKSFAEEIKALWEKEDTQYNEFYFKRVVSLAIIYKATDEIIKRSKWYTENRSYKANVIAYTMSIIFNYIKTKHKNCEIDFKRIWNKQGIYEELENQISVLQTEVHNFITGPRNIENVTEWCKSEICWTNAKEQIWTINNDFIATLISKQEIEEEKKDNKETQKIANEVDCLNKIFAMGAQYWRDVLEWGESRNYLTQKEISILRLTINMFSTSRLINYKQASAVIDARERLINNGMPFHFQ